jgi:hypothetical protein
LRRQFLWIVPLLLTVSSLVFALLLAGAKGAGVADALSLLIGSMSLVATVLAFQHSVRGARPVEPPRALSASARKLAAGLTTAVVGAGTALFYFLVVVKPDVPATDLVEISLGKGMSDNARAELVVPGKPPPRRYFSLTPALVNTKKVGDCVGSAELDITVVRDGRWQEPTTGHRAGVEVKVDLGGTTREARIYFTLHVPDSECRVDLALAEAVLFN